MPMDGLRLIVGLGNPGPEHARTRHNAGSWFADALAQARGGRFGLDAKLFGETCKVEVDGRPVWLLKPATFMNLSGKSVCAALRYFRIEPEQALLAHDELDLPPGTVRLKRGGGAGGHNGLKDTITHLGEDFWRLRLGIGRPAHRDEVIGYVLKRAGAADEERILECVGVAADEFPRLLAEGAGKVMNRLHARPVAPADAADPADGQGPG